MSIKGSPLAGAMHTEDLGTASAPHLIPLPPRFRVDVHRRKLIGLVLKELLQMRGSVRAAMSRPCIYGVFSGRLGGLRPREALCVGCMRCTVEYPEVVQIRRNTAGSELGDGYLAPSHAEAILYEAHRGRVPVRGAGYRGPFGGTGWDGIWLDMSEIVRPTRDGIHGREHISTVVDIGSVPPFLTFDSGGSVAGPEPHVVPLRVPFLFDVPPAGGYKAPLREALAAAAEAVGSVAILPVNEVLGRGLAGPGVVPLIEEPEAPDLEQLPADQPMVELSAWDVRTYDRLGLRFPRSLIWVRMPADADVADAVRHGARVIHLVADYKGYSAGLFILDHIERAHRQLIDEGLREQVTLVGGGGIVAAEHVPKAIACGLDAVTLDVAPWLALQCRVLGDGYENARLEAPDFALDWASQRLRNVVASWRDQLLEVLGAMGIREVRRLRGEHGRLMFQDELQRDAFEGIAGYAV